MTTKSQTLLDELEAIDQAMLEGTATPEQEERGQQLVQLADAAPDLLRAAEYALPLLEVLSGSSDNKRERKAFNKLRAAIAKITAAPRASGAGAPAMKFAKLVYMPQESTPTIATEGNSEAVAYLEFGRHTHRYGHLFAGAPRLLEALKTAEAAIEEATGIMHYENGEPVTALEGWEIARAYDALSSVLVTVQDALSLAEARGKRKP
jgi:hypothetical protein